MENLNVYQKAFVEAVEATIGNGLPYEKFISVFKDATFSMRQLYEMFCVGYDMGKESLK